MASDGLFVSASSQSDVAGRKPFQVQRGYGAALAAARSAQGTVVETRKVGAIGVHRPTMGNLNVLRDAIQATEVTAVPESLQTPMVVSTGGALSPLELMAVLNARSLSDFPVFMTAVGIDTETAYYRISPAVHAMPTHVEILEYVTIIHRAQVYGNMHDFVLGQYYGCALKAPQLGSQQWPTAASNAASFLGSFIEVT